MSTSRNIDNDPEQALPRTNQRLQARLNPQDEERGPLRKPTRPPGRSAKSGESSVWPYKPRSASPVPFNTPAQDGPPISQDVPGFALIKPTPPPGNPDPELHPDSVNPIRGRTNSTAAGTHVSSAGTDSNIWQTVVDQARARDVQLVDGWQRSMDVLLIFAALFASILTAFLIESTKELKNNYREQTVRLLEQIARSLNSTSSDYLPPEPLKPTPNSHLVNRLWYSSLALTLSSAVGAMVAKQWLSEYMTDLTFESRHHASQERFQREARLREFRYDGLTRWHVPEFIGSLPIALHFALLLFWVGLIEYLWDLDLYSAILLLAITGTVFTSYVVSMILPSIFSGCPYKSPIAHLFANAKCALLIILNQWRTQDPDDPIDEKKGWLDALVVCRVLWEEEKDEVDRHGSDLDKQCLERLKKTTRSESTAAWATEQLEELAQRGTSAAAPHHPGPNVATGDRRSHRSANTVDGARGADGIIGNNVNANPIVPSGALAVDLGPSKAG